MKEKRKILERICFLDRCQANESFNESMKLELNNLKIEMENIIVNEEVFRRQMSRAVRIMHGDVTSKYFHNGANGRRNRNIIEKM